MEANDKEGDVFRGYGVRINLKDPVDFLKIKETLTRIGMPKYPDQKLFQSCHIFHKRGSYAIMHFKELFAFDGKHSDTDEDDIAKRNLIVKLLNEWNLLDIEDPEFLEEGNNPIAHISNVRVVPFKDKSNWTFISKYDIGRKPTAQDNT
jgi:hypothetical protein